MPELAAGGASPTVSVARSGRRRLLACRLLIAAWLPLLLWSSLPGTVPGTPLAAALQLLALCAFIILHASLAVGWSGAVAFLLIGYAVSLTMEASSVHTGIPFGWFKHLVATPKLFGIPPYVPLTYGLLGWLAWAQACLIVRRHPAMPAGPARWLAPFLGALILAGYDLAYDSIGSSIKGMWSYRDPGGISGVPLSNFIGWIVTGWIIMAVFAVIEPSLAPRRSSVASTRGYWLLPAIVWGGMVLQYPLLQLGASTGDVVVGGRHFVIADIYAGATILSLLAMLPPAIAALARALMIGAPGARDPVGGN